MRAEPRLRHPEMVADLLRGYLAPEWIGELDLARLESVAEALDAWLDRDEQAPLRRALETWLVQSVLPARLPAVSLPDTVELGEVRAMLGERLRLWGEERRAEGLAEGLAEGEAKGLAEGLAEGEVKGRVEGAAESVLVLIRQLVADGVLTVDEARSRIEQMIARDEIPAAAGRAALERLG